MAADARAMRHAVADDLLARVEVAAAADADGWADLCPHRREAAVGVNAVRQVLGALMRRTPPGPDRQAIKAALAPLLADPMAQLLRGQGPDVVGEALTLHTAILTAELGIEGSVRVTGATPPPPRGSHLKVVQ